MNSRRQSPRLICLASIQTATEGNRTRFRNPAGSVLGNQIDIVVDPNASFGRNGAGSVHHIAFRATDDADQLAWREVITKELSVTTVQQRDYFESIYFREPGGVLYELATDTPGFGIDEPAATLGEALRIPAWLEASRPMIEARLKPIELHQSSASAMTRKGWKVMPDPHANTHVLHTGTPLNQARGAVVLLHGRGASAEDIHCACRRRCIAKAWPISLRKLRTIPGIRSLSSLRAKRTSLI